MITIVLVLNVKKVLIPVLRRKISQVKLDFRRMCTNREFMARQQHQEGETKECFCFYKHKNAGHQDRGWRLNKRSTPHNWDQRALGGGTLPRYCGNKTSIFLLRHLNEGGKPQIWKIVTTSETTYGLTGSSLQAGREKLGRCLCQRKIQTSTWKNIGHIKEDQVSDYVKRASEFCWTLSPPLFHVKLI